TGYFSFIGVDIYFKYVIFLLESKQSAGSSNTSKSFVITNTRFFVLPIANTYDCIKSLASGPGPTTLLQIFFNSLLTSFDAVIVFYNYSLIEIFLKSIEQLVNRNNINQQNHNHYLFALLFDIVAVAMKDCYCIIF
ncbi:hypothetical protein DERP_011172, partial [Dermatophagoides pteronyssinus]